MQECCDLSLSLSLSLSLPPSLTAARVYVMPIENMDISNVTIGDFISFGCRVLTCEEFVTVSFLKGTMSIRQQNITDSTDRIVTANHEVTENTADQYACHVRLPDGTAIMQRFNITGMLADICTVSVFTLIMGLDAC